MPVNPPPLMLKAAPPAEGSTSVLNEVTSWIAANLNCLVFDEPPSVAKETGIELPVTVGLGSPNEKKASVVPVLLSSSNWLSMDPGVFTTPQFTQSSVSTLKPVPSKMTSSPPSGLPMNALPFCPTTLASEKDVA